MHGRRLLLLVLLVPPAPLAAGGAPTEASSPAGNVPVESGTSIDAAMASKWVPKGWKLIGSAGGDLDKDGEDDAVLVLEREDPSHRVANDGLGPSVLNLNPRRLIVLLKTPTGHVESLSRDDFIPSEHSADNPCLADPFLESGGVEVARGALRIDLHYWMSCGSYGVAHSRFTFRHDAGRFQLIGYDRMEFSRSSGEQSEYSTNYLTARKKTTTGLNMFEASTPETTWEKLSLDRKFYLDEMSTSCPADGEETWCQ